MRLTVAAIVTRATIDRRVLSDSAAGFSDRPARRLVRACPARGATWESAPRTSACTVTEAPRDLVPKRPCPCLARCVRPVRVRNASRAVIAAQARTCLHLMIRPVERCRIGRFVAPCTRTPQTVCTGSRLLCFARIEHARSQPLEWPASALAHSDSAPTVTPPQNSYRDICDCHQLLSCHAEPCHTS